MDTLQFIVDRYKLDLTLPNPIKIGQSRWHDLGHLLNDLGFKKGVELGVYRGKFTQTLAKRAPNMEIIGVDAWTAYKGYDDYEKEHLENEAYDEAKVRAARWPNVRLIKGWSADVVKQFEDESLDYIFIDANHHYADVVADINMWSRKVRKGGIVMGHDYFDNRRLEFGVIPAVNGWVESHFIKHLFTWADNCPSWMYVKD
jgi:predicted O-methyltransferase YrrM